MDVYPLKSLCIQTREIRETFVYHFSYRPDGERHVLYCLEIEQFPEFHTQGYIVAHALRDLRMKMEEQGWLLLCQGSRKNIQTIGLAKNMGPGRKGYVLDLDPKTGLYYKNTVVLLDPAEPNEVVTESEREIFYAEWLAVRGIKL